MRLLVAAGLALALALSSGTAAFANVRLTRLSSDPFTNTSDGSQHRTEVEPDTLSAGGTVVSAFQVGRFPNGGSTDIGFAAFGSTGGVTSGLLSLAIPNNTTGQANYDRGSDASVAFDAKHGVWLISFLGIIAVNPSNEGSFKVDVVVSRSTDGGQTFGPPVAVDAPHNLFFDKNWTACDNTPASPHYGNCYTEFDNASFIDQIQMSTSSDGGLTWGPAKTTANGAFGLGGQPLVQPSGTVIVPIVNAFEKTMLAFTSTDGGASWSNTNVISAVHTHANSGGLRTSPLPTAEIDAGGKVYVAWQDCRFEVSCTANDIVLTTSTDGVHWSNVTRIPIDPVGSGVDHFIPGLGVNRSTSGASAQLGLTYYYYPSSACTPSTCQLDAGFVSSGDGGGSWSTPTQLAGPMNLSWLPGTTQGPMVGDYISTSFLSNSAFGVIAVATAPVKGFFNEAMFTPAGGIAVGGGTRSTAADPVLSTSSDHPDRTAPATAN